jgi:hypothetical protein
MKSRFSRVAARVSLAVGAAMATLPLTMGMASAEAPPGPPWHLAGGGFPSEEACRADGLDYLSEPRNHVRAIWCYNNGGTWDMYAISAD